MQKKTSKSKSGSQIQQAMFIAMSMSNEQALLRRCKYAARNAPNVEADWACGKADQRVGGVAFDPSNLAEHKGEITRNRVLEGGHGATLDW